MIGGPRVVIVGGSVAGLAAACRLTEIGCSVRVLERRPDLDEGGRAITLQPNGLSALARIGALEGVRERGLELSRIVFHGRRAQPLVTFDFSDYAHPHPYLVEIAPAAIRRALADRLAALGGDAVSLGCELVRLHRADGANDVRYRDPAGLDHELDADLVIGADGPGSAVRTQLEIATRRLGAPDRYLLGSVDVEIGDRDSVAIVFGPGYADGVAPIPGGTYFWDRVTFRNRDAVETRDLDAWREIYRRRLGPISGHIEGIRSWRELTDIRVSPFWAARQVSEGVVLIGDAAGAVHPHSAQGANLALEDAVALGDALSDHGGRTISGGALKRHGRVRGRRRRRMVGLSVFAAKSLDASGPIWRGVRAVNYRFAYRSRFVRRSILRQTLGR